MNTERVKISELEPGDKIHVAWPKDYEKPSWWKLPEVVTVRNVERNGNEFCLLIEESGGLCLKGIDSEHFNRIIEDIKPEPGDTITFKMEWFNELELKENREFTAKIERVSKDPMKKHKPKCIVIINNEEYGITFDMISKIEKTSRSQLELF